MTPQAPERHPPLRGIGRNVIILGAVSFFNDTASEMLYPLLPLFLSAELGAGPAAIGLIEGAAESVAAFVKLGSGLLSDRLAARKPLVLLGYAVSNVFRPLIGLASLWPQVLALRLVDRVGKGVRTAPRDALIASSSRRDALGAAFGFQRSADHAGAMLGPVLASVLMVTIGLSVRDLFLWSALPGIVAVLLVAWGASESEQTGAGPEHRSAPGAAASSRRPAYRYFLLATFLFTLGNSSDAFLLLRAADLGVGAAHLPILWFVFHLVKTATAMPAGALCDRWGGKPLIALGLALYCLTYAGFAAATESWQAWALFAHYGLYFGLTEGPLRAIVSELSPPGRQGSGFGGYHFMVGLGALPASIVFGFIWELAGAGAAFLFGAGLALMALTIMLACLPPLAPGRATF